MSAFWPTFLLTAFVGSAAIHYGAPRWKERLDARSGSDEPPSADMSRLEAAAQAVRPPPPSSLDPLGMDPKQAPTPRENAAQQVSLAPATLLPEPVTTQPDPDAAGARTGQWGVTTTRAVHYSPTGANLGTLPGGTVVEIQKTLSSSRGRMSVCRYRRSGAWEGPVLIGEEHLVLFSGSASDFPARTLEAVRGYFEAQGQIDSRIATLARQQVEANPYSKPSREAYEKLIALQERGKVLTAERDTASGDARMRAIDELRQMKDEQANLRRTLDALQIRYREWKDRHASRFSALRADDPQIRDYKRQMATLEPEVRKIVPSL